MDAIEISIDDLEFLEFIGGGAFGSVYRGFWKPKNQIVAIKKYATPESSTEVAILAKLAHRNIIQLYGAITADPNQCFVTEYASNGSLYDYLAEHTLDCTEILTWARQIAMGMNYLHNEAPQPVIHRDLKSRNVVLSSDMCAKICDFGCARYLKATTKMTLAGTFPWMSPEAIQQGKVGPPTDAFSYGVVVWELLTSKIPFDGFESIQIAWLVVTHETRLTIPSSCPEKIATLLTSCWHQEPEDRPGFPEILAAINFMMDDQDFPTAAQSFLKLRSEWSEEIASVMEDLKKIERNLIRRERKMNERELWLNAWELKLKQYGSRTPPDNYDVASWGEMEVSQWICYVSEKSNLELEQYASVFTAHNINGNRLLELDAEHLALLVGSIGHRLQMQKAIADLRNRNKDLREFPPLSRESEVPRTRPNMMLQTVILTIIFGNHFRRAASPDHRKWKMYMELDGPEEALMCIKCVHFKFAQDTVSIRQPPFLMDKWLLVENDEEQVECVVEFTSSVKTPRRITQVHKLDFSDGSDCVNVQERPVELTMKQSMSRVSLTARQESASSTSSGGSLAGEQHGVNPLFENLSLSGGAPAWPAAGAAAASSAPNSRRSSWLDSSNAACSSGAPSSSAWFRPDKRLSWPSKGEVKNVVASGPTISSAQSPSQTPSSPRTPTDRSPQLRPSRPSPARQERSPARQQRGGPAYNSGSYGRGGGRGYGRDGGNFRGGGGGGGGSGRGGRGTSGGDYRGAWYRSSRGGAPRYGESQSIPDGRSQHHADNHQPYRRSVSDTERLNRQRAPADDSAASRRGHAHSQRQRQQQQQRNPHG
ncbi:mitogen-activated protein kinase kinase kinase 20-like [Sycon ciliatum]|uniref:mitogen-activated protein kinase kinase kinase 20-like n=1 Tax=Sycon ciliatum TaxID=27933 RepID=UPI0031F691E3